MSIILGLFVFIVWGILEYINVKIIAEYFLFSERRITSATRLILSGVLAFFLVVGFGLRCLEKNIFLARLLIIPIYFKSLILISAQYKIRIKSIFMVVFYEVLVSLLSQNIQLIIGFTTDINNLLIPFIFEIFIELFILIVLLSSLQLKKSRLINIWFSNLSTWHYILFIIILQSLTMIQARIYSDGMPKLNVRITSELLFVSIVILIVQTIIVVERKNSLLGITELLQEHMEIVTEYYYDTIKKDDEIHKFRHDIKNLLIALYDLISDNKNDEALTYIKDIDEICNQGARNFKSGNFIADVVLNSKQTRAEKNSTKIVFKGIIPNEKLKDTDMVILLSNLLDNAIEACEKLPGDKEISINSVLKNNFWVMTVSNPFEGSRRIIGNHIITNKPNKSLHGYGLKNIEQTAIKYDGYMEIRTDNNIFTSKVVMNF